MLTIRREQMEAFSRAAVVRFERDLLEDLRTSQPEAFARAGQPAVLQLIRQAVQRGAPLGITREPDVARLAGLDLRHGAPFERQRGLEWTAEILRDLTIPAGARLVLLEARLAPAAPAAS